MSYEDTLTILTKRIMALGPCILKIDNPWRLFDYPQFLCGDLSPSLAQVRYSLEDAKLRLRRQHG